MKQGLLIAFDDKVVMGMPFFHEIGSKFSLGMQSIGSDILALNGDLIEERSGDFYFVGLFDFYCVFPDGKSTDFFWV